MSGPDARPARGRMAGNAAAEGRLLGESIARAVLDCGRAVTRACLLETLGRIDIARRYHARPAGPFMPGK